jgi:hypothetical protein
MEGEGTQAPMPVLGAAIKRDLAARQRQCVALTAVLGINDPGGELLEPPLAVEIRHALEIEIPLRRGRRAVFLYE